MSVPSPCTTICTMDMEGSYCKGCGRTLEEIRAWPVLSDPEKLQVLEQLKIRKILHK